GSESAAKDMARAAGDETLYEQAVAKYRTIDEKVTEDLKQHERNLFGYCFADPFKPEDLEMKSRAAESRAGANGQPPAESPLSPSTRRQMETIISAGAS